MGGRRCEPASASWKVAWWPRPVSGSVSARSRSEPMSSAVRRHGGAVGGEQLEQLDVVGADGGRLGRRPSTRAPQQLAMGEEPDGDERLDARRRAARRRLAAGGAVGLADGEARDPVLDRRADRLERRGAQDARQRAGRDRRPQRAAGAGGAREQRRAERDEVERGVQQRVGDRGGVLQARRCSATWRSRRCVRRFARAARRAAAMRAPRARRTSAGARGRRRAAARATRRRARRPVEAAGDATGSTPRPRPRGLRLAGSRSLAR